MNRGLLRRVTLAVLLCMLLGGCGGGGGGGTTGSMSMGGGGSIVGSQIPGPQPTPVPTPQPTPPPLPSSRNLAFSISADLTTMTEDNVDPTTGLISPVGSPIPLPPVISPDPLGNNMIAFTADGRTGFVANSATNVAPTQQNPDPAAVVTVLNIDPTTHGITTSTHATFEQNKPTALTVDPSSKFLYVATDLNEPQIEMSVITNGHLGTFTRVGILPSPTVPFPISSLATATIGTREALVAIADDPTTDGFGINVASYIIRQTDGFLVDANGTVTSPDVSSTSLAASSFQLDTVNTPLSRPTAMRTAVVGGSSFVYIGSTSGRVFVSSFNAANGTLNPPALAAGVAATVGGSPVADLQVGTIAGARVLYVLSNATTQQVEAFALNSDGSVGTQIGATASTVNGQSAISLAVDALNRFLYVGTTTDTNVPHTNLVVFTLNSDGSIGAGAAVNNGDTHTSGSPGARSVTLLNLP